MDNKNKEEPFINHINELRNRILITFLFGFIFLSLSYFSTPYFIEYVKETAKTFNFNLNIFKITESVTIYIKIMFFQTIVLVTPFLLLQLYLFTKPALSYKTNRITLMLIPNIILLFAFGSFIGFKLFVPMLINFFIYTSTILGVTTVYSFADFFQFVFLICLIFGFIMELPAIIAFLSLIEVISSSMLKKGRKLAYLVLSVFSIIVTPPDFISDIIVILILLFLYECSLWICLFIEKRRFKNSEGGI